LPVSQRKDIGAVWENYLVSERMKFNAYSGRHPYTYFWRTYDQQEIDWLELKDEHLAGYEFKWKDTRMKFPKAFVDAYPDADKHWITQDNYLDFITGQL
jgi:hypothetical protein